jgi:prepilin-type N-terminal cleavage/methylation domain-containing protein
MSHSFKKGFSLVELLVSLGIMGVLLSVIVFNQKSYTEAALITNVADNLGLTIAQAQTYGLAVKQRAPNTADFTNGYGVSLSTLEDGGEEGFIFFYDVNNSQYYDGGWPCGVAECLEKMEFLGENYIEDFCILRTQGANQCGTTSRVDISFRRPEPDARILFFNSGGNTFTVPNMSGVKITLRSASGLRKYVTVYTTGQISVQ